jgi:type IV secretory pathway protease TraF
MLRVRKGRLAAVMSIVALAVSVCAAFAKLNLRINLSESHVPIGIYRAYPADELRVGDIIAFNINELYLRDGKLYDEKIKTLSPLHMKVIAALSGAVIERSGDIVVVDGEAFDRALIVRDETRKAEYPLVVRDGHVWLMANSVYSYDSRYYGDVPAKIIKEKVRPILARRFRPGLKRRNVAPTPDPN